MKGKYDGRKRNGAHRAAPNNRGRKPRWLRHLGRNDALKVLEKTGGTLTEDSRLQDALKTLNIGKSVM